MSDDYRVKSVTKVGSDIIAVLTPSGNGGDSAVYVGFVLAWPLMMLFGLTGMGNFLLMWFIAIIFSVLWSGLSILLALACIVGLIIHVV